jgi:protein-disulfide isomerase
VIRYLILRSGMTVLPRLCGAPEFIARTIVMSRLSVRIIASVFAILMPLAAAADEGDFPIKADDGTVVANHRVAPELAGQIEKLPGVIVVGNPHGKVTLAEFYDLNCPYCRKASADIAALVRDNAELRLVLVPFPVLGIASIQGSRVELAVARLVSTQKFFDYHHKLYAGRGMIDGNRALEAAKAIGLDVAKVTKIANEDSIGAEMVAHVRLGNALAIQATPGFVINGVAIVGYPGSKALANVIQSVQRCAKVVCSGATH